MNDRYNLGLPPTWYSFLSLSDLFQRDERMEKDLFLYPGKISRERGRGRGSEWYTYFARARLAAPWQFCHARFSQDLCPPTPFNHASYTVIIARLSSTLSPLSPRKLSHTPDNLCVRPFRHLLHENSSATFHHVPPSFLLAESTFSTRPIFPYFLALKHAKDIKNRTC